MKTRAIVMLVALLVFTTACAGPGSLGSDPAAALAPAPDLGGTWQGAYWWLGGSYWADEGIWRLRIAEDGTFALTVTPTLAANNLAKPSSWSGTVVQHGNRVELHTSGGLTIRLARHGHTLFGLANDPATEADIQVKLDRQAKLDRTGRD